MFLVFFYPNDKKYSLSVVAVLMIAKPNSTAEYRGKKSRDISMKLEDQDITGSIMVDSFLSNVCMMSNATPV